MIHRTTLAVLFSAVAACLPHSNAFVAPSAPRTAAVRSLDTQLFGLFDGVKEAFKAPALERSALDAERETPIDRWMGWSVASENDGSSGPASQAVADFVDSMDEANYVSVDLPKPMGVVFEENDSDCGGIFVQSLKAGGVAAENGQLQEGDQLVAVNAEKVSGLAFDDALSKILESTTETTRLTVFRGSAKQFYGATGPSKDWLDEFLVRVSKGPAVASAHTES